MADASARVRVDDFDQLLNTAFAVADHVCGHTFGGRDELTVDDEQPMVEIRDEALDEHSPAVFVRLVERCRHLLRIGQSNRHAAAVVGIEGA